MTTVTVFRCIAGAVDCAKKRNGQFGFTVCVDDDKFKDLNGEACNFLKVLKVEK